MFNQSIPITNGIAYWNNIKRNMNNLYIHLLLVYNNYHKFNTRLFVEVFKNTLLKNTIRSCREYKN